MADDESSLIAALQRRNPSAWSTVVDRHLGEVYGFVHHLVGGDRAVAEDLNQEVWLEAVEGIGRCDATRGGFRNWLFGIARNHVALRYRRRVASEAFIESENSSLLPEEVLEQVEEQSVVRAAMLLLPSDRREALVGKYVEGLSVGAIALRMEKTVKAVESLLSRARGQMRDLLHPYMTQCGNRQRTRGGSSHE